MPVAERPEQANVALYAAYEAFLHRHGARMAEAYAQVIITGLPLDHGALLASILDAERNWMRKSMSDPNDPVISNPNPKVDIRSLRERLEARSTGDIQARALAAVAHNAEAFDWLGRETAEAIRELAALAADVRVLLDGERQAEAAKGRADDMILTCRAEKEAGTVRVTSMRFGGDHVTVRPWQELVIRTEARQVGVYLVNVRPRGARPSQPAWLPAAIEALVEGKTVTVMHDGRLMVDAVISGEEAQPATGYEALIEQTNDALFGDASTVADETRAKREALTGFEARNPNALDRAQAALTRATTIAEQLNAMVNGGPTDAVPHADAPPPPAGGDGAAGLVVDHGAEPGLEGS